MKFNSTFIVFIVLVATLILSLAGCSNVHTFSEKNEDSDTSDKLIKVALLQINPVGADVEANLEKGATFCRKAKSMGADIALMPEMWSIGYSLFSNPSDFEDWKAKAVDSTSAFITHFQHLASELEMSIVITYLEKREGLPRNAAMVIDSKGNRIMTYAKVHTCDFVLGELYTAPGDDFYVCDLPVNRDTVKVGIMICYDREFPESARILMLKGAELILTPNACGLDEQRIHQYQSRAYENAVGVAMANYPKPFQNGHSCAFDCNGDELLVASEDEGVFMTTFELDKIRSYRNNTIHGNAYRRPHKYNLITSPEVDSVFIRNNALTEKFLRMNR